MGRKKKEPYSFIFHHVKGSVLLHNAHTVDDSGIPILGHRLYAYKSSVDRTHKSIYLNPRKK